MLLIKSGQNDTTEIIDSSVQVYTERNPFPYTGDLKVIQANFRLIFGSEGWWSEGVYGKDVISVHP